jgi:predicted glycoside hydrolase/deacetylase ChbG (UPF0249 family)
MKLIVNADDFGMDENVSKSICQFMKDGIATQTTLMVNMPYAKEAIELGKRFGFEDRIGLHLNVLEGKPLTDRITKSNILCNANGQFHDVIRHNKRLRFFLPDFEKKVLCEEFNAQMEVFRSLDLPMRHLDSHGHLGVSLSILPILIDCAKRHGFISTRIYLNLSSNEKGGDMSWLRTAYCRYVSRLIKRAGFKTTDYLAYPWDLMKISNCQNASVEVLCHPQRRLDDFEGTKDTNGALKDWKTPAEVTYGFIKERKVSWEMSTFNTL